MTSGGDTGGTGRISSTGFRNKAHRATRRATENVQPAGLDTVARHWFSLPYSARSCLKLMPFENCTLFLFIAASFSFNALFKNFD